MKSLNSFLKPKRKQNLKFILSDAFVENNGSPIEWEMRQLSSEEGIEIQNQCQGKDNIDILLTYVATALVYPNLKDKDLLDGLSQQVGRPVLKATDALKLITTDTELASLISKYNDHNNLTTNFNDKVEEVKN